MDPLWAVAALQPTLVEFSGAKARELAGPMFALYDTNEAANRRLSDLGLSGLLANLEKRAEEAARDEAKKSEGGDGNRGGNGQPGGGQQGGGQQQGNRGWRQRREQNHATEQQPRQEQSHATDATRGAGGGRNAPLGLGSAWCDACQKTHVGGQAFCWVNSENVLAEAPEHVRKNIIERLLAQPPDRPGGKHGGKGDKGAGRG